MLHNPPFRETMAAVVPSCPETCILLDGGR